MFYFRKYFIVLGCLTSFLFSHSQIESNPQGENGLVKWYSFQEAQELNIKQPKPFLIEIGRAHV